MSYAKDNQPKIIIFLTDGQPTIGEANEDNILQNILSANQARCMIYSIGFGKDAKMKFIQKISLKVCNFNSPIGQNQKCWAKKE